MPQRLFPNVHGDFGLSELVFHNGIVTVTGQILYQEILNPFNVSDEVVCVVERKRFFCIHELFILYVVNQILERSLVEHDIVDECVVTVLRVFNSVDCKLEVIDKREDESILTINRGQCTSWYLLYSFLHGIVLLLAGDNVVSFAENKTLHVERMLHHVVRCKVNIFRYHKTSFRPRYKLYFEKWILT